jgi:hypothetical protein
MTTVKEKWINYAESLGMMAGASEVQLRETQKAFYAGAFGLLSMLMQIEVLDQPTGQLSERDVNTGADQIESWRIELLAFADKVIEEGE